MAIKQIHYQGTTYAVSYELLNPAQKRDILFLHGWGSTKELMKQAFQNTFPEYRHIYVDLPGFGKSSSEKALITEDYVQITTLLLKQLESKPEYIAGHSFGGKVATLLQPVNLILLSSAGIPVEKSLKVKSKIKLAKWMKPILGNSLKNLFMTKDAEGMPEHMYQTLKNVVDEDFREHFSAFRGNAYIFWGKEDRATPLASGEKIHALMAHSHFCPCAGDHFFFLDKGSIIQDFIQNKAA